MFHKINKILDSWHMLPFFVYLKVFCKSYSECLLKSAFSAWNGRQK